MVILSQDGESIVHFTNISHIKSKSIRCSNENVNIFAYTNDKNEDKNGIFLGKYPKEQAKEITKRICEWYQHVCQNQIQNNSIGELEFVFTMPEATKKVVEQDKLVVLKDLATEIAGHPYIKENKEREEKEGNFEEFLEYLGELSDKFML